VPGLRPIAAVSNNMSEKQWSFRSARARSFSMILINSSSEHIFPLALFLVVSVVELTALRRLKNGI
jgi:hypothetical protein